VISLLWSVVWKDVRSLIERKGGTLINVRNTFEKIVILVMLNTAQLTSMHVLETLLKPPEVDKKKL
jgi:hypothetical protein